MVYVVSEFVETVVISSAVVVYVVSMLVETVVVGAAEGNAVQFVVGNVSHWYGQPRLVPQADATSEKKVQKVLYILMTLNNVLKKNKFQCTNMWKKAVQINILFIKMVPFSFQR